MTGKSDQNQPKSGLSTLDFMSLGGPARRILRMMLKNPEMTYSGLLEFAEGLTGSKSFSKDKLDEVLVDLVKDDYLVKEVQDGEDVYKIRLSDKEGSDISRSGSRAEQRSTARTRSGPRMKDLWDTIDVDNPPPKKKQKRPSISLSALSGLEEDDDDNDKKS